ncbi:MAG: hypothetical protein Q7T91_04585 [Sulfuricurvum sp.]|nr:hypothetical protein [Sulfuricurvum sp.]
MMTFLECRDEAINRLTNRLEREIQEQKTSFELLLRRSNTESFLLINSLCFVGARDAEIGNLSKTIHMLKDFDYSKWIGSKREKLENGELGDMKRCDVDLKTDMQWMRQDVCTKEQMWDIANSFYSGDKNLFFQKMFEITKNKSLTDRYTKYFFKSSIKHKSVSQLKS